MKRVIIAFVAAVVCITGGTAFAQTTGLIGKKVTGVFSIEKQDGSKIGEAVIIDGIAYAPVRAIAEASRTNLKVEGKRIIMSSEGQASTTTEEQSPQSNEQTTEPPEYGPPKKTAADINAVIASQKNLIDLANGRIKYIQAGLPALERSSAAGNEVSKKSLDSANQEIAKLQQSIADAEATIAKFEAELQNLNS